MAVANLWGQIQSQLRGFDGYLGIQVPFPHPSQHIKVMFGYVLGFRRILNVFSQVRKDRPNPFLLQSLRGRQRIAKIFSRHEARYRASNEFVFRRVVAQPRVL
jgi:hypothetical protein